MSYQFPQDIDERVKARLSDGLYQSEDDVIREAMDALDQLEQDRLIRWNERNRIAVQQSHKIYPSRSTMRRCLRDFANDWRRKGLLTDGISR